MSANLPDRRHTSSPAGTDAAGVSNRARRYSEQELAAILKRASELQDGADAPTAAGFTLAEIQQIAGEVGIAPGHVAVAAAAIHDTGRDRPNTFLGAPSRFRFEQTVEGEISDDLVADLVNLARRETNLQGRVTEALNSVEWTGRDMWGATFLLVTRQGGRTFISVLVAKTDAAALWGTLGITGSVLGTAAATAILIGAAGLAAPIAIAGGMMGAGGGSLLAMRGMWRRLARRYQQDAHALGELLVALVDERQQSETQHD